MTKAEFLSELRRKLKRLPPGEIDSAIAYYEEYFNDSGNESEQDVIRELGSPSAVASKIIGEFAVSESGNKKPGRTIWIVALAIFASPIALPIAIALFSVIFAVLVTMSALYFAFAACGVALAASGVLTTVAGLCVVFQSVPVACFYAGTGLLCIAIGIALLAVIAGLSKITFIGLQRLTGRLLLRRTA